MNKRRTKENVIPLVIANATNGGSGTRKVDAGRIVGVVAYIPAKNNTGMVRMSIKNSSGEIVSELQHIDNYRSRDAAYLDGCKPLDIPGGEAYTVDIVAPAAFTATTHVDVIFIYADDSCDLN